MKKVIKEFRGDYFFLSNFYPIFITIDGLTFPSVEAAYQAMKCSTKEERKKFVNLSPVEAKHLGKKVTRRFDWYKMRRGVMEQLLKAKFSNEDLRKRLQDTGDATITHENYWKDTYWGVYKGKGKDFLGKILMDIRDMSKVKEEKKYITIIGTRSATKEELRELKDIAEKLHERGYTLRSGGAEGADSVINHLDNVEIIIPWNGFNKSFHDGARIFTLNHLPNRDIAEKLAKKIHPLPEKLSQGALKLHTRNIYQITGVQGANRRALSEKVYFIADEYNGKVQGGTATAVNLARGLKIPTINIRRR